MPELTSADVELFTDGRLLASNVETYRALQRAYATVRQYCGWHVAPKKIGDVMTLDGTGDALLPLPTRKLVTLTSVVEEGVTLNVVDLTWSADGRLLVKKSGAYWSAKLRAVVVTMTHGFDEAKDFDQAVLELIDFSTSKIGAVGFKSHKVDDEEREWFPRSGVYEAGLNTSLLEQYRLIPAI